jgi:hypothetical protein
VAIFLVEVSAIPSMYFHHSLLLIGQYLNYRKLSKVSFNAEIGRHGIAAEK